MIVLSTILGIILAYSWEFFCIHLLKKPEFKILGLKLHHSIYGIICIISGFITLNSIVIGIGIGIVIQHTLTDGFKFISTE